MNEGHVSDQHPAVRPWQQTVLCFVICSISALLLGFVLGWSAALSEPTADAAESSPGQTTSRALPPMGIDEGVTPNVRVVVAPPVLTAAEEAPRAMAVPVAE